MKSDKDVTIFDHKYFVFVEGRNNPTRKQNYAKAIEEAKRLAKLESRKTYVCRIIEAYDTEVVSVAI